MSTEQTELNENVNTIVLDRATGTMSSNGSTGHAVGTGAVLAKAASTMKAADRSTVNDAGEKVEQNPVDITITNNSNGHETHITADATVGEDYEHATWTQISIPKALMTVLAYAGATAPAMESAILEMLSTAADNGGDWDAAFAQVVGDDMTETQADRANAQVAEMRREVVKTSAGRHQVSHMATDE